MHYLIFQLQTDTSKDLEVKSTESIESLDYQNTSMDSVICGNYLSIKLAKKLDKTVNYWKNRKVPHRSKSAICNFNFLIFVSKLFQKYQCKLEVILTFISNAFQNFQPISGESSLGMIS